MDLHPCSPHGLWFRNSALSTELHELPRRSHRSWILPPLTLFFLPPSPLLILFLHLPFSFSPPNFSLFSCTLTLLAPHPSLLREPGGDNTHESWYTKRRKSSLGFSALQTVPNTFLGYLLPYCITHHHPTWSYSTTAGVFILLLPQQTLRPVCVRRGSIHVPVMETTRWKQILGNIHRKTETQSVSLLHWRSDLEGLWEGRQDLPPSQTSGKQPVTG